MAKLVAIGDSLTQGFQSAAISRTAWSFPAMIARSLGLTIPTNFPIPTFPGSGLPFNIEQALHWMEADLGSDIDAREWIFEFPLLLEQFMDEVEDLYERGAGSRPSIYGGFYHNLAVFGFRVLDSFKIDGQYCQNQIDREEGWLEDDFLGLPAAPMYRTALKVLNPKIRSDRNTLSQVGNLQQIVKTEGVENLIIWLGSNDCLGTVIELELKDMPGDNNSDDPQERRRYNLTHPTIFEQDFQELVTQITSFLPIETKVFVGTVPHVTIPPITQGIPPFDGKYFEYYGRFFINADNFSTLFQKHLTKEQVIKIDERIDLFNISIRKIVANQGQNWHSVDIGGVLDRLAIKRNQRSDNPGDVLREFYRSKGMNNHPLLNLNPIPNVLGFATRNRVPYRGGLFSLDGIHPSTMGYGIVAEVFLEEMQKAGVANADPARLNWSKIIAQDSLWQASPILWESVLATAEDNATLWDVIFRVIG